MSDIAKKNSRRNFIKKSTSLSLMAAYPLFPQILSATSAQKYASEHLDVSEFDDWLVFDGLGYLFDLNERNSSDIKISSRMRNALKESGLDCIRFTLRPVKPIYPGDIPALDQAVKSIANTYELVSQNSDILTIPRSAQDIIKAKEEKKLAVTLCFQNSHMLANDLDRIDMFRNLGVLTMQLTYNDANQLGGGANVNPKISLSEFGHSAVQKMNESNVLIDLSHSGEQTCLDAIAASSSPVIISHSGCRALVDIPRNKSDKELRALSDKGGVFGLYFMPFLANDGQAKLAHLVEHIDHALNVCGTEHVSFGTDGSSITGIDDMTAIRKIYSDFTQKRVDSGLAAEGERIENVNFIPDLTGPKMFYKLAKQLVAKGHSKSVARKVMGENAIRVAKEVWGE